VTGLRGTVTSSRHVVACGVLRIMERRMRKGIMSEYMGNLGRYCSVYKIGCSLVDAVF
jgi:hypothetical protein